MMSLRILLLGKDGQVGAALHPRLATLGQVTAHNRSTCDLRKPDQLRKAVQGVRPDLIVNAAAYTAVDQAESENALCRHINAEAPRILAQEARNAGAWLIHYSTDYVFDGTKATAYREDDRPSPLNAYGRAKLEGDLAIAATTPDFTLLRVSWIYGSAGNNFPKSILNLAAQKDELRVVADQFGSPTSADLIAHITAEFVRRYIAVRQNGNANAARGIFNVASSGHVSWHQYAVELVREAHRQGWPLKLSINRIIPISSDEYPTAARRPKNSTLDTEKLRLLFGLDLPPWDFPLKEFIARLIPK